ncbi:hypothetical protein HanOQP8_Chr15g0569131 [Helianthus annuus]|uniref:uncharacterized protein LOC110911494 n=1 Tax=Helianthus annuus TaxID=4232 RepID=UPI000B8EF3B6|nr:uncharacterized protein LOC110911494 [Helianthus annuus]KAJ0472728.1 hypothetical protein HanHA89_Chr15g0610321 [Helianthus annuus]KAJ0648334.1 hypothetical protein HanLR1_Chr15g0571721 [Helianthus annuus]KAJ0652170.1 hypothetical protein HanOQP8_Chr15g0569131 [Helianthus annuus]
MNDDWSIWNIREQDSYFNPETMNDDWSIWNIREQDSYFNPEVEYDNHHDFFTLEFHHGGKFSDFSNLRYEGGNLTYIDKVNSDLFSVNIMNDMLISLGYSEEDIVTYHFKIPGEDLDLGLRPLGTDSDALKLIKYAETTKVIEVYVEHLNTFPRKDVSHEDSDDMGNGSDMGSDYDSDSDSDYIVDEYNIVEDVNVNDMDEFRATVVTEQGEVNEEDEDVPEKEIDDDEFDSQVDSDDDTPLEQVVRDVRKQKKKSKPSKDFPFYIGQSFIDRESLTDFVRLHAVKSRRQLYISRNDFRRFRVICLGGNLTLGSCENKGDGTNVCGSLAKSKAHDRKKKGGGNLVKPNPQPKKAISKTYMPMDLAYFKEGKTQPLGC